MTSLSPTLENISGSKKKTNLDTSIPTKHLDVETPNASWSF